MTKQSLLPIKIVSKNDIQNCSNYIIFKKISACIILKFLPHYVIKKNQLHI